MKGYKATYDMKCLGFEFEVGETYEIEGDLKICENGFHFCQNQQDVLHYYDYNNAFILLEIEALGEVQTEKNKSATSKIKVVRVIPREEYEFMKDNVIHFKNSIEYEEWNTYDEKGNLIHCKDSNRFEEWNTYDEKGNLIHSKNSDGYEAWY